MSKGAGANGKRKGTTMKTTDGMVPRRVDGWETKKAWWQVMMMMPRPEPELSARRPEEGGEGGRR